MQLGRNRPHCRTGDSDEHQLRFAQGSEIGDNGDLLRDLHTRQQTAVFPVSPELCRFVLPVGPHGHLMSVCLGHHSQRRTKATGAQNKQFCHIHSSKQRRRKFTFRDGRFFSRCH